MDALLLLNFSLQISTVCKVHNDAEVALLRFVAFAELHDVRMVEYVEDLGFLQSLHSLLLAHSRNNNLLDNSEGIVTLALNKECFSE